MYEIKYERDSSVPFTEEMVIQLNRLLIGYKNKDSRYYTKLLIDFSFEDHKILSENIYKNNTFLIDGTGVPRYSFEQEQDFIFQSKQKVNEELLKKELQERRDMELLVENNDNQLVFRPTRNRNNNRNRNRNTLNNLVPC